MSTNISHASRMTAPSYDDDVRRGRFCCTQECNERIAGDDLGTAANAAQFRNRIHLLVEDSAGFAPLDLDQARRLVIVHHVHEHELGVAFSGQEAGAQSHPGSGRKIRSCENSLHVLDKFPIDSGRCRCAQRFAPTRWLHPGYDRAQRGRMASATSLTVELAPWKRLASAAATIRNQGEITWLFIGTTRSCRAGSRPRPSPSWRVSFSLPDRRGRRNSP
jgi:hypothetical protein